MSESMNRRDAMGIAFGACAAVGGVFALAGMKKAWDPLPSVKAAGTTTVDISTAEANVLYTEKWRGKPIFIIKKTPEMIAASSDVVKKRDLVIGSDHYMICIGLCTHLGCIPSYEPKNATNNEAFLCACHGATYDQSGINTKAPAPLPMLIPPFKLENGKIILGEAGPEYEKMKADGVLGETPLKA
ncbi:MAG: ubiquinol-cytochrome c reductase iron-sulfur subunit [Arcobacteraceae bacterium]|jgi:ubiquinol-cytochrome c reductase iron-sulfur subunit|nr:ubiquinol-cytochrome c reductase iron-sulfur subunit [Arcobacteraceae bacterium]